MKEKEFDLRSSSNLKEISELKDSVRELGNKLRDLEEEEGEVSDSYKFELERSINKVCKLEHRLGILLSKHTQEREIDTDQILRLRKESTPIPTSEHRARDETSKNDNQEDCVYLAELRLQETDELVRMLTELKLN